MTLDRPGPQLALVADIGGTNARFALADLAPSIPVLTRRETLCTADFPSLESAASHYLSGMDARPQVGAFAVASPISAGSIQLTNRNWTFTRESLQQALHLESLQLFNDFGVIARALPALPLQAIHMLQGDAGAMTRGPVSVIGPGTGLGVALLQGTAPDGWQVLETEGGHASFAAHDADDTLIAEWVRKRFGHASNERVLSGAGLSHIDAALRQGAAAAQPATLPLRDPADIVAAALDGHDIHAHQALMRFCAILGSVAGDTALMHGAHAVAIAGGIVPRFLPFLESSDFLPRLHAKGRLGPTLQSIAVGVVTDSGPGLLGTALLLRGHS